MGYGCITTAPPTSVAVHADSNGVAVAVYTGVHSSIGFSLTDELAKQFAHQLLASIQEREDAKARRAA